MSRVQAAVAWPIEPAAAWFTDTRSKAIRISKGTHSAGVSIVRITTAKQWQGAQGGNSTVPGAI